MPVTFPQPPFKRNNAGRLVAAYDKAFAIQQGTFREAWATVFSVPPDDPEMFMAGLGGMHVLLNAVTNEIAESSIPSKDQFPQHSKSLRKAIFPTRLDEAWRDRRTDIKHEGADSILRFCAGLLPEEDEIPTAELNEIEQSVNELFQTVLKSEIDPDLKKWILDLLKSLDLGIKNYWIYGAESLRESSSFALGEMLKHQKHWSTEETPTASWWTTPLGTIVCRIAVMADTAMSHLKKLKGHYETAKWFLTFVPGAAPGDDSSPPDAPTER